MKVLNDCLDWLKTWDYMAIIYRLIATIIFTVLLKWTGVFRWVRRRYKYATGMRTYRKGLTAECETLIVVGRRHGFKIDDVFIPLDLAPSDLMSLKEKEANTPRGSYVLLGGPGAGKSTLAKKQILEALRRNEGIPFFVRLRDYSGYNTIEDCLIEKIQNSGIPQPELVVKTSLSSHNFLCVLDGLDEVRPHLRNKVCDDINKFYARNFSPLTGKTLIVTCRKEAYRDVPLNIPEIWEVRPLTDNQIQRFAAKWSLDYPPGKNKDTFWRDLAATPRILEIARSPLLLVGGLMQYTESNLGIPDERFEYLARIAKWLVSDWAAAQGQPPDPLRTVYNRVLRRMAFYLHSSETTACAMLQAKELVGSWLPDFGQETSKADDILNSIATKTGILVSEGDSNFIFAQLGLQEYFASLELLERPNVQDVAQLQPKTWWREVILLAAAQLGEPNILLEALFAEDPLLAAAAVAECPTPATNMQDKAIRSCLNGIDSKDRAAAGAVVPLLRKVTGSQEEKLCKELEQRLERDKEVASVVGLSLAIAGTEAATNILGRHPEVWDTCLSEVGYLSTSFENMLVGWIRGGDDQQSGRAAELISTRLSKDRLVELVKLLPTLTAIKAERLAELLLRHVDEAGSRELFSPRDFPLPFLVWVVSYCSPYVRDRDGYLQKRETQLVGRNPLWMIFGDIILTALFLERKNKRFSAEQILNFLTNSISWARSKGQLMCWACASLLSLSLIFGPVFKALLIVPAVLTVAFFVTYPTGRLPGHPYRFFGFRAGNMVTSFLLLVAGALVVLSLTAQENFLLKAPLDVLSQMGIALCCFFAGFSVRGYNFMTILDVPKEASAPKKGGIKFPLWVPVTILYCCALMAAIVMSFFLNIHAAIFCILAVISGCFLVCVIYLIVRLKYSHRIVEKAATAASIRTMSE